MFRLFLLFTLVPVLELTVLIEVGGLIGAWPTIGLCILTGFVGAGLARTQGADVVRRMQDVSRRGGIPAKELLDGVLILVAGVVLLTPGFVTDVAGILLLLPPTRALVRHAVAGQLKGRVQGGSWSTLGGSEPFGGDPRRGPFGSDPRSGGPGPFGPEPPRGGGRPPFEERGGVMGSDQEIVPPERAPRPPRRKSPRVIDVDES
ncbi:MAG: FxsA family protein [Myxococcota bacterium]